MARNREGTSVHIAGVTGSSPVPPTNVSAKNPTKDTGDIGCAATSVANTMTDWQPIETAPKDGTEVLLWLPYKERGYVYVGRWGYYFPHEDRDHDEGPAWVNDNHELIGEPTHFMPLPQPPEER